MNASIHRRQFLETSAAALAGALLGTRVAAASGSRLAVGVRDVMLPRDAGKDSWAALRAIGGESIELNVREDLSLPSLFHPQRTYTAATDAGIKQLADDAGAAGCRIAAFCMSNRFDDRPEEEVEWCAKLARAAQKLGVPAIRIDVVPRKLPAAKFLDFAVEEMKKVMAATESTGVGFGIENHGRTTNDPEFLRPLFERVGAKRLGLTLDIGNFYWFGHPLSKIYELCRTFAPRVIHTHCKSIRFPEEKRETQRAIGWEYGKYNCPIDQGDIDYARVIGILRQAGYGNDLCIENESLGKFAAGRRAEVLAGEVRYLKQRLK